MEVKQIAECAGRMVDEVEKAIVGKRDTVEKSVLALLANGHVLLEDIPGVGKTTLAKALAKVVGGEFKRVQFTPDLLPGDITGGSILDPRTGDFRFVPGPIFANVVLVDEINRATPKTQSSLLESMEERTVTTDGETRILPRPFFVIATQNSIEMTGTYPLPEAQLDRFFMRLSLGYPDRDQEAAILGNGQTHHPLDAVGTATDLHTLMEMQAGVREVFVHETVRQYVVDVVRATRESNQLLMGASPRGSLLLMRAAQACAAMSGNAYVSPDDVKKVAVAVLAHRVLPRAEVRARGGSLEAAIARIVDEVPAPVPVA